MTRSHLGLASAALAFFLLFSTTACGGAAPSGPTALRHHYDEVHIAQFSLDEKTKVLNAQNDWQRARAEQMKIESELRDNKTALAVAKNERKQALLSEESARSEKKAADASGDMNQINSVTKTMRVAELSRRAADDKVAYLKAQRKYLKKELRYREEETYHREARYEHEKAKLGKAKNIAPRGVNYDNFGEQTKERSRRAQKARQKAESLKQKAAAKEKEWKARLAQAEKARGITQDGKSSSSE